MAASLGIKIARFAIVIAIFAAWEVLSRTGIINPRLLPSASARSVFAPVRNVPVRSPGAISAAGAKNVQSRSVTPR